VRRTSDSAQAGLTDDNRYPGRSGACFYPLFCAAYTVATVGYERRRYPGFGHIFAWQERESML